MYNLSFACTCVDIQACIPEHTHNFKRFYIHMQWHFTNWVLVPYIFFFLHHFVLHTNYHNDYNMYFQMVMDPVQHKDRHKIRTLQSLLSDHLCDLYLLSMWTREEFLSTGQWIDKVEKVDLARVLCVFPSVRWKDLKKSPRVDESVRLA